jgi:hypothetical protein
MVIKGLKCFDVREPLEPKTWTSNPALILYDYLTNTRYGTGWSEDLIDVTSFGEVATLCQPDAYDWELDFVIASQTGAQSIIDSMLSHFRGYLHWWNGQIHLRYLDLRAETPLIGIYDEHLARDPSGKAMIGVSQPSNFNTPEGVLVSYTNRRNNWTTDTIPVGEKYGQVNGLNFVGYTRRELALEMGTYTLERQRLNRTYSMVLKPETVGLEINDLITMSFSEIGMVEQLVRIKGSNISMDGSINVTAILEKEELYDKEYQPDSSEVYSVNFPSISEIPPPVENIKIEEEVYDYRDRTFVRLNVTFDEPEEFPWYSHVDVYVTYKDGAGYNTWYDLAYGTTTWNVFAPSPATWNDVMVFPEEDDYVILKSAYDDFQVDPVEETATYYLKFVSVSTYGVRQEWEDAPFIEYEVLGISKIYPPDPSYLWAVLNQDSVDLLSERLTNPDIAGYELRMSNVGTTPTETWASSIFLSFRSSPDVSYSGVKPGEYKFWLGTRHKNDNYCLDPQTTVIEITDPPPGSYNVYERTLNYLTEGTSTNLIVTASTIRVDHDAITPGDPLYGYFISEDLDTDENGANPSGISLAYLLFDFYQDAPGPTATTWDNLAPSPNTWNDFAPLLPTPIKWTDLVGDIASEEAARVDVSFDFSNTPGGPYQTVNRMELLTAVIEGRYVRVKIEITDIVESRYIVVGPSTFKSGYLESVLLIGA